MKDLSVIFTKLFATSRMVCKFILPILLLSGCSGENCIDADDFGFAHLTVSSRYETRELSDQNKSPQIAPWRDSHFLVNGRPLVILIRAWEYPDDPNDSSSTSAWSPWYGNSDDKNKLSNFCVRLRDCKFVDNRMCTSGTDARISNAPCIFRNGVGLYALIAEKETDPNASFVTQRDPAGITMHLGEKPVGYQMYDFDRHGNQREAGGLVYLYQEEGENSDALKRRYASSKLYFKIVDKFYNDNNGQYRISIKSGITLTDSDPISLISNLVTKFLFGADNDYGLIRNLYLGIVNNPEYRLAVSALLTLYIMFTAFSYLAGNLNVSQTELVIRIAKVGLVSALLSTEYSWKFFNDYLFVYFVGGVQQIIKMIMDAGASGSGSSGLVSLMISSETMAKLFSLLFVDWRGFIYILLFLATLVFVILVFLKATIIYLTALLAIGMIITMGPIFICFMLFERTKSLFQNWLKQLISYAIQPVILFTGITMISMILRQEIYGAMGFKVCKRNFPQMTNGGAGIFSDAAKKILGMDLGDSLFYWWFPMPMKGEQFSRQLHPIPVPVDHYVTSSGSAVVGGSISNNVGDFCEAYGCIEPRYVDLPYLDPVKDQRRINQFWNGQFVQFDGLLLIIVAIYLLHKFNETAVSVAKFLTGTAGNMTNISNVGQAATSNMLDKTRAALSTMMSRGKEVDPKGATDAAGRSRGGATRNTLDKTQNIDESRDTVSTATTTSNVQSRIDSHSPDSPTLAVNSSARSIQQAGEQLSRNNGEMKKSLDNIRSARKEESKDDKGAQSTKQLIAAERKSAEEMLNSSQKLAQQATKDAAAAKDAVDRGLKAVDEKSKKLEAMEAQLAQDQKEGKDTTALKEQIDAARKDIASELKDLRAEKKAADMALLEAKTKEKEARQIMRDIVEEERKATTERLDKLDMENVDKRKHGSTLKLEEDKELAEIKAEKEGISNRLEVLKDEAEGLAASDPKLEKINKEKEKLELREKELSTREQVISDLRDAKAVEYEKDLPEKVMQERASLVKDIDALRQKIDGIDQMEQDSNTRTMEETKQMAEQISRIEEFTFQNDPVASREAELNAQMSEIQTNLDQQIAEIKSGLGDKLDGEFSVENVEKAIQSSDPTEQPKLTDSLNKMKQSMEAYDKTQDELAKVDSLKAEIAEWSKEHLQAVNQASKAAGGHDDYTNTTDNKVGSRRSIGAKDHLLMK